MQTDRRGFIRTAATGLAATAAAATAPACQPAASPGVSRATGARAAGAPFELTMQFYGLMVHGSWAAAKPDDPRRWDVLMIREAHHKPQLRVLAQDVMKHKSGKPDRLNPQMLWWPLTNVDVLVAIDGTSYGNVTPATKKRPNDSLGVPTSCPVSTVDEQFEDITWVPSLTDLLQKKDPKARLRPELKDDAIKMPPGGDVASRVRLTTGQIKSARPSAEEFEHIRRKYTLPPYPQFHPQFYTDLVRFTATVNSKLTLELVPFGDTSGEIVEIAPGLTSALVLIDHIDPAPASHETMPGEFCGSHFRPYYKTYNVTIRPDELPCPDDQEYCDHIGDPPYYCVPIRGDFE